MRTSSIAGIVDGGLVVDGRAAAHRQVGGLEQLERGLLERALGEDEAQHAGSAALGQLAQEVGHLDGGLGRLVALVARLGAGPPMACSMVSTVRTPKTTGTPVSSATLAMPEATLLATWS